jgi:hypothetical protein
MRIVSRGMAITLAALSLTASALAQSSPFTVSTYHYDNLRTGWNNKETRLTATGFPDGKSSKFGVLYTVTLDGQINGQPLVIPNLTIGGGHDVVYVATEANTIYAVDATTGAILVNKNLGNPVTSSVPSGCVDHGHNIGIKSTPVIDPSKAILYTVAYTLSTTGTPSFYLHALDLNTLANKPGSPVTVTASHTLTNGSNYTFNAGVQRQRPGLMLTNGNIYVGFGSACDTLGSSARGWLLGWDATTLTPLLSNRLDDTQATSPTNFFLSSIWMSGYGIASDGTDLYFATGNSDCNFSVSPEQCPSNSTWDGKTNIQESVVRLSSDLTTLHGVFTPTTSPNTLALDRQDLELGAGGVLLLPPLSGTSLAVAAGKDGRLFLLNRTSGLALAYLENRSPCWCGPSYFVGPDGISRVVTSQGNLLHTFRVNLSSSPKLSVAGTSNITSGQDPGFFTSVSSNGTTPGSAIIWAVSRPSSSPPTVTLYAFNALSSGGTYQNLFSSVAGSWPHTGMNANIVPVVSNSQVYVASAFLDSSGNVRGQLNVFGVCPKSGCTGKPLISSVAPLSVSSDHVVSGILIETNGTILTLKTRNGKISLVDASQALKNEQIGTPLIVGVSLTVSGSTVEATGALLADSIARARGSSGDLWPADK